MSPFILISSCGNGSQGALWPCCLQWLPLHRGLAASAFCQAFRGLGFALAALAFALAGALALRLVLPLPLPWHWAGPCLALKLELDLDLDLEFELELYLDPELDLELQLELDLELELELQLQLQLDLELWSEKPRVTEQLSPGATATRACVLQLLRAMCPRAGTPQEEEPPQ